MENTNTKKDYHQVASEMFIAIDQGDVQFKFDFPKNQTPTLAYCTIIFWPLIMKGFRVMQSEFQNNKGEYINIVPPAIPSRAQPGTRYTVFFVEDKKLWDLMQNKIAEAYYKAKKEIYEKSE